MKFAWVTGGDEKYISMVKVLAKSLEKYSNYKLIVYGFNTDPNISSPNVINRRINFPILGKEEEVNDLINKDYSFYFAKYIANLESFKEEFDIFCWIDGDAFVTKDIDISLNHLKSLEDYPLCMRYWHKDIVNQRKVNGIQLEGHYGSELSSLKNIKRNPNKRILATGFYFYDRRSKSFFQKCLDWNQELSKQSVTVWTDDNAFSEERVANCVMWEEDKENCCNITWCNHNNPKEEIAISSYFIENFINEKWDVMFCGDSLKPLFIHGPTPPATKNAKVLEKAFNKYFKSNKPVKKVENIEKFNWGNSNEWYQKTITEEIFKNKIYEKFFEVEENDIVMDVGASIGPFSHTLKDRNLKHLYCIEPSPSQLALLEENIISIPSIIVPYVISDSSKEIPDFFGDEGSSSVVESKEFKDIIKEYNIEKIDFLKTDCEGGEYNIFNIDNLCWLKENLKKCSGEWHLSTPETKQKFREFRDVFLRVFPKHKVYSVDGIDIKWDLWNEHFIEYYNEVIIYIDNR